MPRPSPPIRPALANHAIALASEIAARETPEPGVWAPRQEE